MKSLKFVFLFCLVLVGARVNAQRYAVAPGNWNAAIWATTPGGVAGSAATPTSADNVFTNGRSININGSYSCHNLFVSYNVANSLVFGSGRTLTYTGTLSGWDDANGFEEYPTAQVFSFASASRIISTGANVDTFYTPYVLFLWDNTVPINRITFQFGSSSTYSILNSLNVAGILTVQSGTLAPDPGAFINCTGTLAINAGATLTTDDPIHGGNSSSYVSVINLNGTLNTSSYVNSSSITIGSAGILNTSFDGTDQTQGWWYQGNSPSSLSLDPASTVNYRASANQNIAIESYGNLTLSGSGTKTVVSGGSVNIAGNLTFNNTGVVLTSPQTTVFDGTGAQQISGGGTANFDGGVTLNKTAGTLTVAQDINWQGVLNLNQGTLTCTSNSTITATGTASITGSVVPSLYSLAVSGAGTLTSSSGNINIAGNFTNNGAFNANSGTLTFNGSSSQSILGSTNTSFNNIASSNSSTVTFSSSQSLTGALSLSAGTLNANGNLTLLSTAAGDASIAQITGGTISGSVNAQRYLPNAGSVRDYRFLASPVTNATVSQWKNSFPITGTFNDPSTSAEWPGFTNPVVNQTAPSLFLYNEAHTPTSTQQDRYESFPANGSSSTSTTLVNGSGYAAFVRQTVPVTITVTGTPKQGNANVSVTAQSAGGNDGWNLIGNPYAAPISWDNVTIPSGVGTQIALLDNTGAIGTAGNYVYYTQAVGGTHSGIIPSGQAFWVRASANATITFQENDKTAVSNPVFAREGSLADLLRIKVSGNDKADELIIYFRESASDIAEGRSDAFKLKNPVINFSSLSSDGVELAINGMGALGCSKEVALSLKGVTPGKHTLNFSELSNFNSGIALTLVDNYTGKTQTITADVPAYEFDVTSDGATFGSSRFKVQFGYPSLLTNLNVQGENVCAGTDAKVTVSNSQNGVSYYATLNGNTISNTTVGNGAVLDLAIPHDKLAKGNNQVIIMANWSGCSTIALDQTSTIKTDDIYAVASVIDGAVCKQGEVSLGASGAPVDGSYHWYASSDLASPISGQTGSTLVTPILNKSKTYYVSVVNSLGCEGTKREVLATVTAFDNASITQIDEVTLQSNFDSGNQWYFNDQSIAGATGKTLVITESGDYKLKVTIAGCETSAGRTMIVTDLKSKLENGQVYPNPVSKNLTIKLPSENGEAKGIVQNELGQNIGLIKFERTDNALIGEFNFEEKMPGIYIVRITQGNSITNHKIVKK